MEPFQHCEAISGVSRRCSVEVECRWMGLRTMQAYSISCRIGDVQVDIGPTTGSNDPERSLRCKPGRKRRTFIDTDDYCNVWTAY